MKIITTNNAPTMSEGMGERKKMGMRMNAKAFRLITDGLYLNKVGSIVRELSSNARDAHKDAGRLDIPFTIHVPDTLQPWFSVTDTGIGMSHDTVMNIYGDYFASTKDHDNSGIGGFGIGGKTPLAYTDKYTVVSIYEGVRSIYSVFYNESGEPDIVLVDSYETDEQNGVSVEVPVKPSNFINFRNEIIAQLRHFPVKPILVNAAGLAFPEAPTYLYEDDDIAIVDTSHMDYTERNAWSEPQALLGPVGYKIDRRLIVEKLGEYSDDVSPEQVAWVQNLMQSNNIVFKFGIGEIGVTASRENIEYTDHTVEAFVRMVKRTHTNVMNEVHKLLKDAKTPYEKVKKLNDMSTFSFMMKSMDIQFDGITVKRSSNSGQTTYTIWLGAEHGLIEDRVGFGGGTTYKNPMTFVTTYTRNNANLNGLSASRTSLDDLTFTPGKDEGKIELMVRDVTKLPMARIRNYMNANPGIEKLHVISALDAYPTLFANDRVLDVVTEGMGGHKIITRLSAQPEPQRVSGAGRARGSYSRPTAYSSNYTHDFSESMADWNREYAKLDDPEFGLDEDGDDDTPIAKAYYVAVEYQKVVSSIPRNYFRYLMSNGLLESLPLFGIRTADIDKLASTTIEWVDLSKAIDDKIAELKKTPGLSKYQTVGEIIDAIEEEFSELNDFEGFEPHTRHYKLKKILQRANDYRVKHKELSPIISLVGAPTMAHWVERATKYAEEVDNGLPLMRHINTRSMNDAAKAQLVLLINTATKVQG